MESYGGEYITLNADADLSAKQYFLVKQSADGEAALAAAATDAILGVLQNKPKAGEAANIQISGTAKVSAGGILTPGCWVTSDAAGEAIATTTDKDVVIGIYLGGANCADGDIVEILLTHFTLSHA